MAYTIQDTPAIVERIEQDLARIQQAVGQADPRLRSLVLTGGFARGEGAVLDGQPQNDYDLVAIRGIGRPDRPYDEVAEELEAALGLHIDLAPIGSWRLRWVRGSIFWYETARRGQVLHGPDLLDRIPIRSPEAIEPGEGLRLLTNRAAGLLLATDEADGDEVRLQAAKGLLASLDAHLLAEGTFPPSQRERWQALLALWEDHDPPPAIQEEREHLAWAYRWKVDPSGAKARDPQEVWSAARRAILGAVPMALDHAKLPSLAVYGRGDGVVDHLVHQARAGQVPGGKRLVLNPTGKVRVGTLRLLEATPDGQVTPEDARRHLGSLASVERQPLATLEALRGATLQ